MQYRAGVLLLLLLTAPAWAQSVRLPAEAKGEPGAFVKVPADTDGAHVRWYSPDRGLQLFPVELLKDSKTAVVTATAPGRYRLVAWTAKGDVPSDPAVCVVVIGEPGPEPGPGPTPPVPPVPPDPLTKTLQAAYDRETDAKKTELKASLAALYRQGAEVASKPEITTWGQLFNVMKSAATTLGVSGKLPVVQEAVATDLKDRLPTDGTKTLTTDDRVLAAQTFKRIAGALEGVK